METCFSLCLIYILSLITHFLSHHSLPLFIHLSISVPCFFLSSFSLLSLRWCNGGLTSGFRVLWAVGFGLRFVGVVYWWVMGIVVVVAWARRWIGQVLGWCFWGGRVVRWWLEFGWIVSRFCLLWVWVLLAMVGIVGCFFFFFGGGFTGCVDGGFVGCWWWWCQVCVVQ